MRNAVSNEQSLLFGRFSPFALALLVGCLTLVASVSSQLVGARAGEARIRFDAAQPHHKEATEFLDHFSQAVADRGYGAADFFFTMRRGASDELVSQKQQEYFAVRRAMITRIPIFGARGHILFGAEFKNGIFLVLSTSFDQLDEYLQTYQRAPTKDLEAKIVEQQHQIDLLHGQLLGIAMRSLGDLEDRAFRK